MFSSTQQLKNQNTLLSNREILISKAVEHGPQFLKYSTAAYGIQESTCQISCL